MPNQSFDKQIRGLRGRPSLVLGLRSNVLSGHRLGRRRDTRDDRGGDAGEMIEVPDELARACDLRTDRLGGEWSDERVHFYKDRVMQG